MAKLRPCPWCKGKHRHKRQARQCYERHHGRRPWTKAEVGY